MTTPSISVAINQLTHQVAHDLDFYYLKDYHQLIYQGSELHPKVLEVIKFVKDYHQKGFRKEVTIESTPLLVYFNYENSSVHLYTRQASHELMLLEMMDYLIHFPEQIKETQDLMDSYGQLKEHLKYVMQQNRGELASEWQWISYRYKLPTFDDEKWEDIEKKTQKLAEKLVDEISSYRPSLLEKVSDWALGLTAHYSLIRVHLLKFLAILPSLDFDKSGEEVKRNLLEAIRRLVTDHEKLKLSGQSTHLIKLLPASYIYSLKVVHQLSKLLHPRILAILVRFCVRNMARRFISGQSIEDSTHTLKTLLKSSRDVTLDQLGELVVSQQEADQYMEDVLKIIRGLKESYVTGEVNGADIPRAHVSIKVSGLCEDFKPHAFDYTFEKIKPRLEKILLAAKEEQVFINIDAEHYHYRDTVLQVYGKVLLENSELQSYRHTGIVLQAYLNDCYVHLEDIISLAKKRGHVMPIRLVKGAYWDAETIEATAHSFESYQFLNKEETDLHFRQMAYKILQAHDCLQLSIGSHNIADHCFVETVRQEFFPQAPVIEHQCLHMTYEALSCALAKVGWPTRNYMPLGNLLVGMSYLVRRIMENSSQVGVLTIMRSHNKKEAFIPPLEVHLEKIKNEQLIFDPLQEGLDHYYKNSTSARMYLAHERELFKEQLRKDYQRFKGNQKTSKSLLSNSNEELVLGDYQETSLDEISSWINASFEKMNSEDLWHHCYPGHRIASLLKVSRLMLLKKNELSSLIVYEAGKSWVEALADVEEAVDFIEFYCRHEWKIFLEKKVLYPLGIVGVIAPWNFPLAIACGMSVSALVTGNKVILKPAEQTPFIAVELEKIFRQAGIGEDIFKLVLGDEKAGKIIVSSERVGGILFTGSKQVGTAIYQQVFGQKINHPLLKIETRKKVVTEMGGKNAIIVTSNCEMDEAVSGILYSAFAHAGQKCSAASRIIVNKNVKDLLIHRLKEAIRDIKVGEAYDPSVVINPLVTKEDKQRVLSAIKLATQEAKEVGGRVIIDRSQEELPGQCIGPCLIELPAECGFNKESWAQKEIFAPVIHLMAYEDLSHALEIFNATEYALTGGVFAQSQDDIDFLIDGMTCGNIYVNRANTGARVGIEPFGGFKMSGTGPKAGGRFYLDTLHLRTPLNLQTLDDELESHKKGMSYLPILSSAIRPTGRYKRLLKLEEIYILRNFEILTGKILPIKKDHYTEFFDWFKINFLNFLSMPVENVKIPGQSSYSLFNRPLKAVCFCVWNEHISSECLKLFISSIGLGCGTVIICYTQKSYVVWKDLVQNAWEHGFSKLNLEIYLACDEIAREVFSDQNIEGIIFEDSLNHGDKFFVLTKSYLNSESQYMRRVIHPSELINQGPESFLLSLLNERSFAINNLRHGAPLDDISS